MPKADVGPNVKIFLQENALFCGEANAKMARNGYPDPGNRVPYDQKYLSNIIKAHNSNRNDDKRKWNTDPEGLRLCLQLLSSSPVNWVECASTDRWETQQFILQCIGQEKFPTPVLINRGFHWVLVVGWETTVAAGGVENLKFVHYYDPQQDCKGADTTATSTVWNSPKSFSAVQIKGTWVNRFVAVGQRSA